MKKYSNIAKIANNNVTLKIKMDKNIRFAHNTDWLPGRAPAKPGWRKGDIIGNRPRLGRGELPGKAAAGPRAAAKLSKNGL